MLHPTNSTASSLDSLIQSDSIKCFSIEEAKTLLSFANKGLKCDSLISVYDNELEVLDQIIDEKDNQILIGQQIIADQAQRIDKLEGQRRWFAIGLGVSGLAVLLLALFK